MTYFNDLIATPLSQNWVPNTSVTHHATLYPSSLQRVKECIGNVNLWVGNDARLNISTIGHTSISYPSRVLHLQNVLHVPILTSSLLFVKHFTTNNNVIFKFHHSFFVVKDPTPTKFYFREKAQGGLYKLQIKNPIAFITLKAPLEVWHNRLGHSHLKVLHTILRHCPVSKSLNNIYSFSLHYLLTLN